MDNRDHDRERLEDVQEMTEPELAVYEAAAALNVDDRPATVAGISGMTGLPEEAVRYCLDALVGGGRLVPRGDAYLLGPHDWGVSY